MRTLTIEDEVLGNVRQLPLGPVDHPVGTVADLNLPLDFLRRIADRVIQASFRDRWRVVVGGGLEHSPPPVPERSAAIPSWVSVQPLRGLPVPPSDGGEWQECRPAIRGFRAPILGGSRWPFSMPRDGQSAAAARLVNSRIAFEGIEKTLARIREMLGISAIVTGSDGERFVGNHDADVVARIRSSGIPVDLVGLASVGGPGFAATAENGSLPTRIVRVQLTGSGYYAGSGDGGSLDVLRQLMGMLNDVTFLVSVESRHADGVLSQLGAWPVGQGVRVVVIPEHSAVAQWARDNGVAGRSVNTEGASSEGGAATGDPTLLVPRWAGRGEEGGIFIPGESWIAEGIAAAGVRVAQSRLLFEGGNLMVVEDGRKRVMLLGEAEVWRNTALGLSRDEVLDYFKREFGVEQVVVLPASSFHIDLELTVGSLPGGGCVAFVLDTLAAVRIIARIAARRLAQAGVMSGDAATLCEPATAPLGVLLSSLGSVLESASVGPGRFRLEFAKLFSVSEVDSGVGNLKRVLFACDYLTAEMGAGQTAEGHYGAFLRSMRRMERDRASIARQLKQLGWKVVKVPGVSAESVSLNALNGLWVGGKRFLLSAYGGFLEEVDEAAAAVFRGEGFEVDRVLTGETQRRGGGLHCAVSTLS